MRKWLISLTDKRIETVVEFDDMFSSDKRIVFSDGDKRIWVSDFNKVYAHFLNQGIEEIVQTEGARKVW